MKTTAMFGLALRGLGMLAASLVATAHAQVSQTSSVLAGMGTRSTGGSYTHIGAGGQPGGIATSQGGSFYFYNQAGFLNTFFLQPHLDTDGNGIPDEADWDNDGDRLADLDEILGTQFDPKTPTNPNLWDTDGNGVSDYDETIAGTDPTNPDAAFKVVRIARVVGGQDLGWIARGGKTYVVHARTNLLSGAWTPIATNTAIGGIPPWYVVTNVVFHATSVQSQFYTVEVLP